MHFASATALLALTVGFSSHAQQAPVIGMRPSSPGRHALVGARVIVAPGTTIERATVLVRDGVIEAVGADIVPPDGFRIFDVTGKTLCAAFIEPALVAESTDLQSVVLRAPGAHWNQYVTPEVRAHANHCVGRPFRCQRSSSAFGSIFFSLTGSGVAKVGRSMGAAALSPLSFGPT